MINPKKELFKWGPIDGKPIYTDAFVQAFESYPQFIEGSWPDVIQYFKNDVVVVITENEEN